VSNDLTERIGVLPDEDAIAALAFVLDVEDASNQDLAQLRAVEGKLPEAFAATPDLGEITAPVLTPTAGDLARTALVYLAEQESTRELVGRALDRPAREGQREPVSFAVGGLVLLALRTDVELKRTLGKLWGLFGGGNGSAQA
jgi:hypothetical protein